MHRPAFSVGVIKILRRDRKVCQLAQKLHLKDYTISVTETMTRFMKPACIFIVALLFISTENCNGSVLENLDEDYKRAGELKKPVIFEGKVGNQYDNHIS